MMSGKLEVVALEDKMWETPLRWFNHVKGGSYMQQWSKNIDATGTSREEEYLSKTG